MDRRSKGLGSSGSAAVRLLGEARRREIFPAIAFRDTSPGRMAWVHGTRIRVASLLQLGESSDAAQVAKHYCWPLWQVESVLAYIRAHHSEIDGDLQVLQNAEISLPKRLPAIQKFAA